MKLKDFINTEKYDETLNLEIKPPKEKPLGDFPKLQNKKIISEPTKPKKPKKGN